MSEQEKQANDAYLWRGGEKLAIRKIPGAFTARVKRGIQASEVAKQSQCEFEASLSRQKLELFSVEPDKIERVMAFVRSGEEVMFASHVYGIEGDQMSRMFLTDEITVQFLPDLSTRDMEEIIETYGLEIVKSVQGMDRTFVLRVTASARENPIKIANRLVDSGKVILAEPNVTVASQTFYRPSDNLYSDQWHLYHEGGVQLAENSHIHVEEAWEMTRGERSIVVAIADDSVDMNHIDFSGEGKIVAPRDFKGRDFEPLPESSDDNHGTSCAGVAVAEENGQGVVGVAPGCALMPLRMTGYLDDDSIEDMFEWAMNQGASVISCSWGPSALNFPLSSRQKNLFSRVATQGRNGKGCVIVFAAGNANRPINGTVDEKGWPGNSPSGPTRWLDGYAADPHVIAVAATNSYGKKSAYSNWGKEISVCAPSNNGHPGIGYSITYPRITTPILGRGVVTTDRVGPSGYSTSDYTFDFGGTSSACPTVAGVVGLVLSANPELTAQEVKEVLQQTADKIFDDQVDPQLGLAYGDYDENGHSQWFGYGKVNAARAVAEALRRKGDTGEQPAETINIESSPQLPVPDNDPDGVIDAIRVEQQGLLTDIQVRLDISHSYRGDLKCTLISPSNKSVILQNRQGGGSNDLKATFTLQDTVGLSAFVGEQIQGEWLLLVQDLARIDTGTLHQWELTLKAGEDSSLLLEESPGAAIPDNDRMGITRELATQADGTINSIEVEVDISHTYKSDLIVELEAPAGTKVVLHNRTGGSANNIFETYTFANNTGLLELKGQAVAGTWRLTVKDLAGLDTGKLNRWAIKMIRA